MTLHRPRRIFRASPFSLPRVGPAAMRAMLLAALGTLGLGGVALVLFSVGMFSRASLPTRHVAAGPAEVAVIDAGTLRVDRLVVRLLGVDPPQRGEACGPAGDCGAAGANALATLVRQKPVTCALQGEDGMGRPLGVCDAAGTELNRAVIAAGWARADSDRPELRQLERGARADRIGLWAAP